LPSALVCDSVKCRQFLCYCNVQNYPLFNYYKISLTDSNMWAFAVEPERILTSDSYLFLFVLRDERERGEREREREKGA